MKKEVMLPLSKIAVIALFILILIPSLVEAGVCPSSITVTSTSDSGLGSLRDAISTICPGGTINITATGTITLQSALPTISQDLTINGPGASSLMIDGAGSYQVFNIASGTVSISGLTISNGSAEVGGGIYNSGSLTLTNCTISGNSVSAYIGNGGGILNYGGTLTVTNCTIFGNSVSGEYAASGGGIYNYNGTSCR